MSLKLSHTFAEVCLYEHIIHFF